MQNITLVGNGFVGKTIQKLYGNNICLKYDSKNFHTMQNQKHETVFCAAPSGKKWICNKNPEEDKTNCIELSKALIASSTEKIILFSTIDIFSTDFMIKDERSQNYSNEPYGKHRLFLETQIKQNFNDYHIIRLPALFGEFLQKNYIFDLINNNQLNQIKLQSSFQWFFIERLRFYINFVMLNNIKILNLTTEPLPTTELIDTFFPSKKHLLNQTEPGKNYNVKSKFFIDDYAQTKQEVLLDLASFIK